MQLNFWLLPDIFFLYLSTKLPPITYVLESRDGSNISPHIYVYLSQKILTEMQCELCARACLTDSVFASHFWFLEGV